MGPRSHERGNAVAFNRVQGDEDMLQWGRVLMNAETIGESFDVDASRLASMGPRSHERGNAVCVCVASVVCSLQWGRVLMNAETLPTST